MIVFDNPKCDFFRTTIWFDNRTSVVIILMLCSRKTPYLYVTAGRRDQEALPPPDSGDLLWSEIILQCFRKCKTTKSIINNLNTFIYPYTINENVHWWEIDIHCNLKLKFRKTLIISEYFNYSIETTNIFSVIC